MSGDQNNGNSVRIPVRWVWIIVAGALGLVGGGSGMGFLQTTWASDKPLIEYRLEQIENTLEKIADKLGVK